MTPRAPKTTFGIGTLIDQRYRLDAELGRGGMGIVYRARDLPNNRDVEIKVINVGAANVTARSVFARGADGCASKFCIGRLKSQQQKHKTCLRRLEAQSPKGDFVHL